MCINCVRHLQTTHLQRTRSNCKPSRRHDQSQTTPPPGWLEHHPSLLESVIRSAVLPLLWVASGIGRHFHHDRYQNRMGLLFLSRNLRLRHRNGCGLYSGNERSIKAWDVSLVFLFIASLFWRKLSMPNDITGLQFGKPCWQNAKFWRMNWCPKYHIRMEGCGYIKFAMNLVKELDPSRMSILSWHAGNSTIV